VSDSAKFVGVGIGTPGDTVGLTGLVPFAIVQAPEARLRAADGVLRVHVDLPAGRTLRSDAPMRYRIYGGEAGLEFPRNGQIITIAGAKLPLELPYQRRFYPEPPPITQLVLDLAFRHDAGFQDVQWRVPITWDPAGTTRIDLEFTLPV